MAVMPMMSMRTISFLAVLVVAQVGAWAQVNVLDSDPIAARKRLVYSQIGGFVGLGANSQGGTIVTGCNCEFTGGGGAGLLVGAQFERLTRSTFTWGMTLGYEGRSVTGQFREIEGVPQTSPAGRTFTVPVTFLNEANVSLAVLTATPYVKYHFFERFYARLGVSVGYVVSSSLEHTKTLETTEVTFPDGETASVSLPDAPDGTYTVENGPVADLQPLQLGIVPGVGLDIRLSKKMFLSPVVQYMLPLTSISAQGTGFSVRSFQFSLEVRHIL